jgi:thiamine biosynthesis lipoprotein
MFSRIASACGLAALLAPCSCDRQQTGYSLTIRAMGIEQTLVTYSADTEAAERQLAAGAEAVRRIDALMSAHNPDSELSRLNAAEHGQWHSVSAELMEVLTLSRRVSELSGGAFDVTVLPLVRLWQRAEEEGRLPTEAEIAAARAAVGWEGVELDEENGRVRLNKPGMRIDLGAVAKGYSADLAAAAMKAAGATCGLIKTGVFAFGLKPGGETWITGVRDPRAPAREQPAGSEPPSIARLAVTDRAVVTSGHYERFVTIGGKRYSHIFDPRTGRPVDQQLASVTVVAATGGLADALATAVAVLGEQEGMALIERLEEVEALLVADDGPGKPLRMVRSSGLAAMEMP